MDMMKKRLKLIQQEYKNNFVAATDRKGFLYPIDASGKNFLRLSKMPSIKTDLEITELQEAINARRKKQYADNTRHVFTDIDGVINTAASLARGLRLDAHSVNVLEELVSYHNCVIHVLSAGWSSKDYVSEVLWCFGLRRQVAKVVHFDSGTGSKCLSLMHYLHENPSITNFIILEDEPSEYFAFRNNMFVIDRTVGLIAQDKKEIIGRLK